MIVTEDLSEYIAALDIRTWVANRYKDFIDSKGTDTTAEKDIEKSVPPGLYEHFKSKPDDCKFYIVTGAGTKQTTLEDEAYYTSAYGSRAGRPTSRHLIDEDDGFLMPIKREGIYVGLRFKFILALEPLEIGILIQRIRILSEIRDAEEFKLYVKQLLKK